MKNEPNVCVEWIDIEDPIVIYIDVIVELDGQLS